jgi:hypothetical protein
MTLVTPYFTHVYRATIKNHKKHLMMRFEVAADSLAQAEGIVSAFIHDKHQSLEAHGYTMKVKRIQRHWTEAVILVG